MEEERGVMFAVVADYADELQVYVYRCATISANRKQLHTQPAWWNDTQHRFTQILYYTFVH